VPRHSASRTFLAHRRRFLSGTLAVAATMPAAARLGLGQSREVNVYNWDIGETTLEDFTEATGINVRYDLFASNDELFAKLREATPATTSSILRTTTSGA
jgi:spermidine/putrescine transport system substrate-binding protein